MADNTILVGFARLWGDCEQRIILGNGINPTLMKGYDDMDLARLLDSWAYEYVHELPCQPDLTEFFNRKLLALCKITNSRYAASPDGEPQTAILVELDYKGCYERFALTPAEFQKRYPDTYESFGPITKEGSDTISSLVHIWFKPCIVEDDSWEEFFSAMEDGLPDSDIERNNLATIRLDRFGELMYYIAPSTYLSANSHTGVGYEQLYCEWSNAISKEAEVDPCL